MNFDTDKKYFLNGPLGQELCLALTGPSNKPLFKNNSDFSESHRTRELFLQLRAALLAGDADAWQINTHGGHPRGLNVIGMMVDDGRQLHLSLGHSGEWYNSVTATPLTTTPAEYEQAMATIARAPALLKKAAAAEKLARFYAVGDELANEGRLVEKLPVVDCAALYVEATRRALVDDPTTSAFREKRAADLLAENPNDNGTAKVLAAHALAKTTAPLTGWAVALEVLGGDAYGPQQRFIPVGVGLSRQEAADTLATWRAKGQRGWHDLYKPDDGPSESFFHPERFGKIVAMATEDLPLGRTFFSDQCKPNLHHLKIEDSSTFRAAMAAVRGDAPAGTSRVVTGVLEMLKKEDDGVAIRLQLEDGTFHRLTASGKPANKLTATPIGAKVALLMQPSKDGGLGRVVAAKHVVPSDAFFKDKGVR